MPLIFKTHKQKNRKQLRNSRKI